MDPLSEAIIALQQLGYKPADAERMAKKAAGEGDAAEAKGKEGTVSAMGVERSLADAAKEQSTTEDALCKQMDALLKQLATQVPS